MSDTNTILISVNTLSTIGLVFAVGMNWGDYKRWRSEVDQAIAENKTSIAAIHAQDIRNVKVDSQIEKQAGLIDLLGQRTHDLLNVLQVAELLPKNMKLSGFNKPVSGQGGGGD